MNEMYRLVELMPNFYAIEERDVRMFLLVGEEEAVLIDSGFGGGDLKDFSQKVCPVPVKCVINTHADIDHLGCNHQFDRILMHPAEFDRFCSGGKRSAEGLVPLWEGEQITVGDYTFEVILIPGHTPGSIALLEREKRFLISGDSVQDDAIFMFGAGRNMPAFVRSMEKLQGIAHCFDTVYPSHGSITVTPDIIPDLKQGAISVMAGRVEGQPPIWEGMPCKLYHCGNVKFLYDLPEA